MTSQTIKVSEPESPEFRYKTPIDQCDVVDGEALERYRAKRYEWLSWYELRKGEPNTIQQQLFSMMFLDSAYRILASARESTDGSAEFAAQSGLLANWHATGDESLRRFGDEWIRAGHTAALLVPSAAIRGGWNILLNPVHPTFAKSDSKTRSPLNSTRECSVEGSLGITARLAGRRATDVSRASLLLAFVSA
jgi:hypothetical protein